MRRFLLSMCIVALAGCSPKLSDEKSFEVDSGSGGNFYDIPAAKADQKVTVAAKDSKTADFSLKPQ